MFKRIGPLAAPHLHLLYLPLFTCYPLRKLIKIYLSVLAVIPCSRSLVINFCSTLGSTLLLIENATIGPLHLWVIRRPKKQRTDYQRDLSEGNSPSLNSNTGGLPSRSRRWRWRRGSNFRMSQACNKTEMQGASQVQATIMV